jgi:urea transport system ATP-binding protein
MTKDILYIEAVTVDFNGFKALNSVNLIMDRGELRFLIGPNGAGKTTLLDVICRKIVPQSGRIVFDGEREMGRLPVHKVARLGISRKFQAPSVFSNLTVRENMELAYPRNRDVFSSLFHFLAPGETDEIEHTLERVGLADLGQKLASRLSHGQKQWLEIALTLLQKPKLLLVDEPVAGMTGQERIRTGELLQAIAQETSVLVVEHDMNFVKTFSTTVTCLHEGSVLCEGSFEKVSTDARVMEVYLGRGGKG